MGELDNPSEMAVSTASGEAPLSSSGFESTPQALPPPKKKRNLPGMPDPDAEVIALSPKALMATNRFVCEICSKGFQRDQNLQLHRRGHNLPWKLRQRTTKEIRKRVYVCPEPSCVHHNPSRALGDLTGIKKHFCRKHGEKKWKCERCSKKYAVQSDWKAHMKTCGTREYKCDCGTLFSRRDSFITHRAFCDALAEESARTQPPGPGEVPEGNPNVRAVVASPPPPPLTPSTDVVSPALSIQSSEMPENPIGLSQPTSSKATCLPSTATASSSSTNATSVFASIFAPSTAVPPQSSPFSFSNLISGLARSECPNSLSTVSAIEPTSLSLSTSLYLSNNSSPLFPDQQDPRHYSASPQPALSATALLQKAAQLGAAGSNASLLRGLGLATSSSCGQDDTRSVQQWNSHVKTENNSVAAGLGLGLPSGGNTGFNDVMMGSSLPFGAQPMTRDLLGLSIGGTGNGVTTTGGLSALLNSFGSGFDVPATTSSSFEGGARRRAT
ncbi:Protein indeterminate-domain like [Quillaja saponaria]|uniref:Protein indeterminate-domain like n=1 Tax=Quillaja saponaria TaxID=32244 RepID=A0AAD7LHN9_QUISA|nr:Protein indeterminate-domain like [Quillaja saponaria]